MSPDDFQKAWQAESSRTRIAVDTEVLLRHVQRSQENFRATIRWRDYSEVGTAAVMIPLWFFLGYMFSLPWSWYLVVPAIVWGMGFIVFDRMRHKPKPSEPGGPLLSSVTTSVAEVEHQIYLLRNVVWWYLLPYAIPIIIFFVHSSWITTGNWLAAVAVASFFSAFVLVLYAFVYYLNLRAVRTRLEPQRKELLALLASLGDETPGEVPGEFPILMSEKGVNCLRRRLIVTALVFLTIFLIGVPIALLGAMYSKLWNGNDYKKLAPFTDVTWGKDAPVIKVDGEWNLVFSIDGVNVKDIVAFCQRTYGDKWQKRFAEDLVEVLTTMGHEPKDTVLLDVLPVSKDAKRVVKEVPMTAENRRAVRDAAQERDESKVELEKYSAESRDTPAVPLGELVANLRKEKELVGLAAMVMVDGKVVDSAADGVRKVRSNAHVTTEDQWHLGSITKSVTATMIARLVEAGSMEWTDSVGECFPDATIHDDWKAVTLRQLLTHTSGAPANFGVGIRFERPAIGAESTAARREAVLGVMTRKPEHEPGSTYGYSNVGFTIAGAMAEEVTGETWDALVQREVFDPLGLTSAGFGPPKSVNKKLEQPQGHRTAFWWKAAMGEGADNTFIMGPAGIVHMTLEDLCTYATEHLRGELGEGTLLSAETYTLLHTPVLDDYAFGWVKKEPSGTLPHTVYWHNGSNTMWYALVVFVPDTKTVVSVTSNDGDVSMAEAAAWEIVRNSAKPAAEKSEQ